jgi:hypothetical protein
LSECCCGSDCGCSSRGSFAGQVPGAVDENLLPRRRRNTHTEVENYSVSVVHEWILGKLLQSTSTIEIRSCSGCLRVMTASVNAEPRARSQIQSVRTSRAIASKRRRRAGRRRAGSAQRQPERTHARNKVGM